MTTADILTVIVNYRTPELTEKCLEALAGERTSELRISAIVVDGGSNDGSAEKLSKAISRPEFLEWVEFLPLELNGGFGWANNQAILHKALNDEELPEFIFLLNPDAVVEKGAVSALVDEMRRNEKCAAAGAQLIDLNGDLTGSAFRFPTISREFLDGLSIGRVGSLMGIEPTLIESDIPVKADWVTGACVMLRTSALDGSGLFDDSFFLYFEEVELMHRLTKAGWEMWFVPHSRASHVGGASTGVKSGATVARQPLPSYWYASRYRYYVSTHGFWYANIVTLCWTTGSVLRMSLATFIPELRARGIPGHRKKLLSTIFGKQKNAPASKISRIGSLPGRNPAWLNLCR